MSLKDNTYYWPLYWYHYWSAKPCLGNTVIYSITTLWIWNTYIALSTAIAWHVHTTSTQRSKFCYTVVTEKIIVWMHHWQYMWTYIQHIMASVLAMWQHRVYTNFHFYDYCGHIENCTVNTTVWSRSVFERFHGVGDEKCYSHYSCTVSFSNCGLWIENTFILLANLWSNRHTVGTVTITE